MNYNKDELSKKLDEIYTYVESIKKTKIDKNSFKKEILDIVEKYNKNNKKISNYWYNNFSFYIYEMSKKMNYETFFLKISNKIDKKLYELFYSLHRHANYLELIDKKQFFELLEALEALKSFNFKVIELKKWSKWLTEVFDNEIISQYSKYIENPIIYFLVIIRDVLLPLKQIKIKEKQVFYKELKNAQKFFQSELVVDEKKYNEKLKNVQKYDQKKVKELELSKEDKDLEILLIFAKKYKISILRLFQFLSFPFYIEELESIPQDILFNHQDNIIVYSGKYYWGFELSASEYFYRLIAKYLRIIPQIFLFEKIHNNNNNIEYFKFKKLIDFFLVTENEKNLSLLNLILNLNKNDIINFDVSLRSYDIITNHEIFEKLKKLEFKSKHEVN